MSNVPVRVVHYLNQFFGGIGGEEKADVPVEVRLGDGPGCRGAGTICVEQPPNTQLFDG